MPEFEDAVRQWLERIPFLPEMPQYYIARYSAGMVVYTDASGEEHHVVREEVHGALVLTSGLPLTLIAVENGEVYAVSPLLEVNQ